MCMNCIFIAYYIVGNECLCYIRNMYSNVSFIAMSLKCIMRLTYINEKFDNSNVCNLRLQTYLYIASVVHI